MQHRNTRSVFMLALLMVSAGISRGGESITVAKFSDGVAGEILTQEWLPLAFKKIEKHTVYSLIDDSGTVVVKAQSEAAASGLTHAMRIDPKRYPLLRWRWKVDHVIQKGDVRTRQGDDYAARIYITFAYEPDKVSFGKKVKYKAAQFLYGDVPIGAINYIWDNKTPVGAIVDNSYTDFVKMIVVESGNDKAGLWLEEERNIYQDYKLAFGEEPPMISGIAIMTDTDNTGSSATAYYGDITFAASP